MADYTKYPTGTDLVLLLKSINAFPADGLTTLIALATEQADIAAQAAADEFENSTGWLPFLANPTATPRYFDHTNQTGILDFQGGLIADPAPVVSIGDTTYTLNENYYLQPANAPDRRKAYTQMQFTQTHFSGRTWSLPNRITITGRWGYCTTLPGDVWAAIQKKGGVQLLASMENLQNIGSISQDGFSKSYDVTGVITQLQLLTTWGNDFTKFVTRYTRVTC